MEFLRYHEFFNNLMGLPYIIETETNAAHKRLKSLRWLYQRITELIVFLSVVSQILAVPSVWFDMNILCGCLSSGTHSLQVLLKTIFLNYYRKDFVRFLKTMEHIQKRFRDFEAGRLNKRTNFADYYLKRSKYVRLMLIAHFIITFSSTSAYFLPFVYDSLLNYETVENQSTPIVIYLPVNFNWTPLFQMILLLLTTAFYLNNLKTVVIDNFILGLIVLVTSHFRYQKQLLKRFIAVYFRQNDYVSGSESLTPENKKAFTDWIILHQELLKYLISAARLWKNMMSPYLLLEFSSILIHTCVPAFVITSTFSWTVAQKMAVFFIVGGGLVQLLLMSKAGDSFIHSWETIDEDLFRPTLYEKKEKWMFHVFTIIKARLNPPFRLSAYEIFPLRCATFATISRLIVSHYMTLNQIQTMKSVKN